MAEISVEQIKKLKELSGAGLTDAKKALVEADGDFDKALEAMRKKCKEMNGKIFTEDKKNLGKRRDFFLQNFMV